MDTRRGTTEMIIHLRYLRAILLLALPSTSKPRTRSSHILEVTPASIVAGRSRRNEVLIVVARAEELVIVIMIISSCS